MKSNSIYILLVLFFASCGVDKEEYYDFLFNPENGLVAKSSSANNVYKLMYYPVDLMVAREIVNSDQSEKKLRDDFGREDYFLLEIKKNNKSSDEKQNFYYAYQFQNDIYQTISGDTLRPNMYQLEQGIGGSQQMKINLAFSSVDIDRHIFIEDKYGINTSLTIKQKDIVNLPKLRI